MSAAMKMASTGPPSETTNNVRELGIINAIAQNDRASTNTNHVGHTEFNGGEFPHKEWGGESSCQMSTILIQNNFASIDATLEKSTKKRIRRRK